MFNKLTSESLLFMAKIYFKLIFDLIATQCYVKYLHLISMHTIPKQMNIFNTFPTIAYFCVKAYNAVQESLDCFSSGNHEYREIDPDSRPNATKYLHGNRFITRKM